MKAFNAGHFFRQSHRQVPLPLAEFTVHAKGARGSASGQKCTADDFAFALASSLSLPELSLSLSLSLSLASLLVPSREGRTAETIRRGDFPRPTLLPGGGTSRGWRAGEGDLFPRGRARDSAERGTKTRAPRRARGRKMAGRGGRVKSQAALFRSRQFSWTWAFRRRKRATPTSLSSTSSSSSRCFTTA